MFRTEPSREPDGASPERRSPRRPAARWSGRWFLRRLAQSLLVVAALLFCAGLAVYAAGQAGVGKERLRVEAEKAIRAATGMDVDVMLGGARLTLDGVRLLAVEANDVHVMNAGTKTAILDADRMRFGLRLLPLLQGRVELGRASLANARFVPSRVHRIGGTEWNPHIRNERGLIDPGLVSRLVFREMHRTFEFVAVAGTRKLHLQDVKLVLPDRGETLDLSINELTITRSSSGRISFIGDAAFLSRHVAFDGSSSRSADKVRIESLEASLSVSEPRHASVRDGPDNPQTSFGSFTLSVSGAEEGPDTDRLSLDVHLADARLDLGEQGAMTASGEIRASISAGSDRVSIDRARVTAGRSIFDFEGVVRPLERQTPDALPAYGFKLLSQNSTVAPTDSPEPALPIDASVSGRYTPSDREIVADSVEVRTPGGTMIASASMRFQPGATPGISLAISATGLPTSHVKQLWPWFAAWGPRKWVLEHVFGGRVEEASIRLNVPPGRLGNGQPLSAEEVHGHFKVADTRFDIAGRMPPVRDGDGSIDFAGTDTRITLSAGSVFMPGGLSVSTDGGTFTIENAEIFPRIGKLEIDVAGAAPAILKLASYDPINAGRFFDIGPDDISGEVTGHISADIPLDGGDSTAELGWRASFEYEDLALSKPISGQTITGAEGTLVLAPERADIEAEADLNGIPATIDMVEPLGGSAVERKRDIRLTLNDEAREKLAPGLDTILSGTATMKLDDQGEGRQKVTMDLTQSTLSLPWIGWQKGKGVPASADFILDQDEGRTTIETFSLSGDSFGARGQIELAEGRLSSARFTQASLNRGDDFAVSIRRDGNGYAVSVDGEAFDGRALVKRLSADGAGGTGDASAASIHLTAKLESVGGFNGESLHDVDLTYSGNGGLASDMKLSAAAKSGGAVSATEDSGALRVEAADAGALLRFLDLYAHMQGGSITLDLARDDKGMLSGKVSARDFSIVNEPRLGSLVSAAPTGARGATNAPRAEKIDGSSVAFDRGFALLSKGNGYLKVARGVLRGPSIGTTFQGTVYDPNGNIELTGTFMPIYGLNRVFGEIPFFGKILGNGRDRGLIGVTFKLTGKTKEPQLQINPISVIAPGILRQIFEFR